MNEIVGIIATTTKLASKLGVGTVVSGVIENAVNVAELSAFRKTCVAAASITITGAVGMVTDKYVDVTADKASELIEDIKSRVKAKEDIKVETTVEKEEDKKEEPKKTSKKKNTTKKKKEEKIPEPKEESKEDESKEA